MPKKKLRITPYALLMLGFFLMLALGIWLIILSQQPPRITHSLPYTV